MIGMAAGLLGGGGGGGMVPSGPSSSATSAASGNTWGSMGDWNYKSSVNERDYTMLILGGVAIVAFALMYSKKR